MPFGPYANFDECLADNQDKDNPEAYCGALEQRLKSMSEIDMVKTSSMAGWRSYFPPNIDVSPMLDLGPGASRPKGFVGVGFGDQAQIWKDLEQTPWPLDSNFAGVIRANQVLEYLTDPVAAMTEIYRILQPGGISIIAVPSTKNVAVFGKSEYKSYWNKASFAFWMDSNLAASIQGQSRPTSMFEVEYLGEREEGDVVFIDAVLRKSLESELYKSHSRKQCMECRAMPVIEALWAEGMGHAWFCAKHFKAWEKIVGNHDNHYASDICATRVIRYGVAPDRWRDGQMTRDASEKFLAKLTEIPIARSMPSWGYIPQLSMIDKTAKIEQPPGFLKESEQIKINRESSKSQDSHKFMPAEWTHPNGHPRCILCGHSERVGGTCEGISAEEKAPPGFGKQLSTGDFGGPGQAPLSVEHGHSIQIWWDFKREKPPWIQADSFVKDHIPRPKNDLGLDAEETLHTSPYTEEGINFREDQETFHTGKVCGACRFYLRALESIEGKCQILPLNVSVPWWWTSDAYIGAREEAVVSLSHTELEKASRSGSIQSLIFDKKVFDTRSKAIKWAKDHDFNFGKVDETENTWRLRQFPPDECRTGFRNIDITEGVQGALCLPSDARETTKEANHEGAMVALYLPSKEARDMAIRGKEPASGLHITLAYMGEASELSDDQVESLNQMVAKQVSETEPITIKVEGTDTFRPGPSSDGKTPFFASVNSASLKSFRSKLVNALQDAGVPVDMVHPDYTPHITLAYLDKDEDRPDIEVEVEIEFKTLWTSVGDKDKEYIFGIHKQEVASEQEAIPEIYVDMGEFVKVDEEKRYTFGVVYRATNNENRPDIDAHNEFVTADELQDSLHDHVRKGDRRIYIQHGMVEAIGFKEAGEWVEITTFPHEVKVDLKLPGQSPVSDTIPAGSAYLGVIWQPWSWKLVKEGKIRGFSFGGLARREPA